MGLGFRFSSKERARECEGIMTADKGTESHIQRFYREKAVLLSCRFLRGSSAARWRSG